jgi:phenylacetate-CoA ligase
VSAEQRDVIAAAFGCPVRETYGQAEMAAHASECPAGRLHQWPEFGYVEVWNDGAPVSPGSSGEFLCTTLINPDMPLIRYRVGDRGRIAAAGTRCECRRELPLYGGIDGRTTDVVITRDGRRVFWLNPVFYGLPIREAQIVQEALGRFRIRVARAPGFTEDSGRTIVSRVLDRVGDAVVDLEYVETVPRAPNGKFRAVVSELAREASKPGREQPAEAGMS